MRHLLGLSILVIAIAAAAFSVFGESGKASAAAGQAYYQGSIYLDGATPATGGLIRAETVDGVVCGTGMVYVTASAPKSAYYAMTVNSSSVQAGCFDGADPIIFRFKGIKAQEVAYFSQWGSQYANLTFKTPRYFPCTPALCPISMTPVFMLPPSR